MSSISYFVRLAIPHTSYYISKEKGKLIKHYAMKIFRGVEV
jgi:hypothetical protein